MKINDVISNPLDLYIVQLGALSFFASLILFFIWKYIHNKKKTSDHGILFISLAMFTWFLSAMLMIVVTNDDINIILNGLFSTLNSGFLLLAFMYFDHKPIFFSRISSKSQWKNFVMLICILVFIINIASLLYIKITGNVTIVKWAVLPDLILSFITVVILGFSLFETFKNRKLVWVGRMSILVVLLIVSTQLIGVCEEFGYDLFVKRKFDGYDISLTALFIRFIARALLIIIFFALASSWLFELLHLPRPQDFDFRMYVANDEEKNKLCIEYTLRPNIINRKILLSNSKPTNPYLLLTKFAYHRKYASDEEEQYLIVAPRGVTRGKATPLQREKIDIYDHNQMTQIINLLNSEGITNMQHGDLFEKTNFRQYRLRIHPDNIKIDLMALSEFSPDFHECFKKCSSPAFDNLMAQA